MQKVATGSERDDVSAALTKLRSLALHFSQQNKNAEIIAEITQKLTGYSVCICHSFCFPHLLTHYAV